MSATYQALEAVKNIESTNAKLTYLKNNKSLATLKEAFSLAYDTAMNFGIKPQPFVYYTSGLTEKYSLEEIFEIIKTKFVTREVSGNAARDLLRHILENTSHENAKVVWLVFQRDLECGASASSANKVWPGLIEEQPQALCQPYNEKTIKAIKYKPYALAQLKADGTRAFAEITVDEESDEVVDIIFMTRAKNQINGLEHIKKEIELLYHASNIKRGSFMLDGELTYHDETGVESRQFGNGVINSAISGEATSELLQNIKYEVWDLVPLDEVYSGKPSTDGYEKRFNDLTEFVASSENNILWPVETTIVYNIEEATDIYWKYIDQGLEGIILKNIDCKWEDKRLKGQVKFKDELFADLVVTGYKLHSKDPTKIGSLECKTSCGTLVVGIGSGFTDTTRVRDKVTKEWIEIPLLDRPEEDRTRLLQEFEDRVLGSIVEVKFNNIIKPSNSETHSLFLPTFVQFRKDKNVANSKDEIEQAKLDRRANQKP